VKSLSATTSGHHLRRADRTRTHQHKNTRTSVKDDVCGRLYTTCSVTDGVVSNVVVVLFAAFRHCADAERNVLLVVGRSAAAALLGMRRCICRWVPVLERHQSYHQHYSVACHVERSIDIENSEELFSGSLCSVHSNEPHTFVEESIGYVT
jgi:hypothetical protein